MGMSCASAETCVRCSIARAFGPIAATGRRFAINALAEWVVDARLDVRLAAAQGLGVAAKSVGNTRAIHILQQIVRGGDGLHAGIASVARAVTAGVQIHFGDNTALDTLQDLAFDHNDLVRRAAANALGPVAAAGHLPAIQTLHLMAVSAQCAFRCAAAEGLIPLAAVGHERASNHLRELLRDENCSVRDTAEQAVSPDATAGHQWAVELAIRSMNHCMRDAAFKVSVARAASGNLDVLKAMSAATCDTDENIVRAAKRALHNAGIALGSQLLVSGQQTVDYCQRYLDDEDDGVKKFALRALSSAASKGRIEAVHVILGFAKTNQIHGAMISNALVSASRHLRRAATTGDARAKSALEEIMVLDSADARCTGQHVLEFSPIASANVTLQVSVASCCVSNTCLMPSAAARLEKLHKTSSPAVTSVTLVVNSKMFLMSCSNCTRTPSGSALKDLIKREARGKILYYEKLEFVLERGVKADWAIVPSALAVVKVRGPKFVLGLFSSWLTEVAGQAKLGSASPNTPTSPWSRRKNVRDLAEASFSRVAGQGGDYDYCYYDNDFDASEGENDTDQDET